MPSPSSTAARPVFCCETARATLSMSGGNAVKTRDDDGPLLLVPVSTEKDDSVGRVVVAVGEINACTLEGRGCKAGRGE